MHMQSANSKRLGRALMSSVIGNVMREAKISARKAANVIGNLLAYPKDFLTKPFNSTIGKTVTYITDATIGYILGDRLYRWYKGEITTDYALGPIHADSLNNAAFNMILANIPGARAENNVPQTIYSRPALERYYTLKKNANNLKKINENLENPPRQSAHPLGIMAASLAGVSAATIALKKLYNRLNH